MSELISSRIWEKLWNKEFKKIELRRPHRFALWSFCFYIISLKSISMAKSKINWGNYFIELLVVIIGISIAFALENVSKSNKNSKEEGLYVQALQEDLKKDIAQLESIVDSSKVLINYTSEVFQFIYSNAPTERFKRNHIVSSYATPYFKTNNGTYLSLINSGDLKILSDFELRSALTDLYNVQYGEIERMDLFIRSLVTDIIYPYVLEEITFAQRRDGIEDASPLKTNKAINLLGSYFNFLSGRIETIEKVIEHCKEVESLLNKVE